MIMGKDRQWLMAYETLRETLLRRSLNSALHVISGRG